MAEAVDDGLVAVLVDMGFDSEVSATALLIHENSLEQAIDWSLALSRPLQRSINISMHFIFPPFLEKRRSYFVISRAQFLAGSLSWPLLPQSETLLTFSFSPNTT